MVNVVDLWANVEYVHVGWANWGWGYKPHPSGVWDNPEGWVFAAENRGRMKINGKIFNGAFKNKDKLKLKNLFIKQLPKRFTNKANIVWKYVR